MVLASPVRTLSLCLSRLPIEPQAALKEYEPRVVEMTDLLVKQFRERVGTDVDIVAWSNYYGFDVMGEVGFGKPWGMLESGKLHEAIKQLHEAMVPLGLLGPVPWMLRMLTDLPISSPVQNFMDWCWMQLAVKKKVWRCVNIKLVGANNSRLRD